MDPDLGDLERDGDQKEECDSNLWWQMARLRRRTPSAEHPIYSGAGSVPDHG